MGGLMDASRLRWIYLWYVDNILLLVVLGLLSGCGRRDSISDDRGAPSMAGSGSEEGASERGAPSMAGSGSGTEWAPGMQGAEATPAPTRNLFELVSGAAIEGEAAHYAADEIREETQLLFEADFEDGTLDRMRPLSSRSEQATMKRVVEVVEEEAGGEVGHVLHLGPGVHGPESVVTPPIPLAPDTRYTLSWRARARGTPEGSAGERIAVPEVLFYKLLPYEHNVAYVLGDLERRRPWRVAHPPLIGVPPPSDGAWIEGTLEIVPPSGATHMLVSFDHSRTGSDEGVGDVSQGDVYFDEVRIRGRGRPLFTSHATDVDLRARPHPLQIEAELPTPTRGAEKRLALYAPAPTRLAFEMRLPNRPRLSVAAGFFPEAWMQRRGGVRFAVDVVDEDGRETRVDEFELRIDSGKRGWHPMTIDLDAFAGHRVVLKLVTEPLEGTRPGTLPADAALWGDPVLFSREDGGRLVVLLVLDTISRNHLSIYGYKRETSPRMAEMAGAGMVFDEARSSAPWTLPSFASIFTGLPPWVHGAGERAWGEAIWRRPLASNVVTLAEAFRAAGFQTAAFVNNPYLTSSFGLGQGFSTYYDWGLGTERGAGAVGIDLAEAWLREHSGGDRFLLMHLMDAHGPYRPPSEWAFRFADPNYDPGARFARGMDSRTYIDLAERNAPADDPRTRARVRDLYDGAVAYVDHLSGRLYEQARAAAPASALTFILTADHGEELWEHEGFDHGHELYDELLRVPLIVVGPWVAHPGSRNRARVQLTDIAPTLAAAFGLEAPALGGGGGIGGGDFSGGRDLRALLSGAARWTKPRLGFAGGILYGPDKATVIQDRFKLIYHMQNSDQAKRARPATARHALYDLDRDAAEKHPIQDHPEVMTRMHGLLEPQVVSGWAGRYLIVLDSGGEAPALFRGRLVADPGLAWFKFHEDFIQAMPDGRDGRLKVVSRGNGLVFEVEAPRAVLGLRFENTKALSERLLVSFRIDGAAHSPVLRLGGGTVVEYHGENKELFNNELMMTNARIPASGEAPFIFIGRTPDRGAAEDAALPAATRERLRALGYIR